MHSRCPMHATSLSLQDWENILRPVLIPLKQKLGIVKSWNMTLLFHPDSHNGLNCHHPYYWQHILQLETLYSESLHKSPTGVLIQSTTEQLRSDAGWAGNVTDIPIEVLHILPVSWLKSLTRFAIECKLQLKDSYPKLQLARNKDIFLMKLFFDQEIRTS